MSVVILVLPEGEGALERAAMELLALAHGPGLPATAPVAAPAAPAAPPPLASPPAPAVADRAALARAALAHADRRAPPPLPPPAPTPVAGDEPGPVRCGALGCRAPLPEDGRYALYRDGAWAPVPLAEFAAATPPGDLRCAAHLAPP